MDEAVAWAKRSPNPMPGPSEIEIRPFYEAADLAEFVTPEELSAPRDGERGKLGVACHAAAKSRSSASHSGRSSSQ
jgi:hypothetical protein